MKLISLNVWGGKIYEPLINFINENAEDTDIFCFQEIFKTTSVKKDCASRIRQSEKLKSFLSQQQGGKILCGDFNLDINTKSVKILEESMTNLTADDFGIFLSKA